MLSVPANEQTLAQQAQQTLTEETGYAKAISSALTSPSGQSSTLRALATSTQSALVPLSMVAAAAPASLAGTDNLISWVDGGRAQPSNARPPPRNAKRSSRLPPRTRQPWIQTPTSPPVTSTFVTPSGSPVPGSLGRQQRGVRLRYRHPVRMGRRAELAIRTSSPAPERCARSRTTSSWSSPPRATTQT